VFAIIFSLLNGRFVYANLKYWLLVGPVPIAGWQNNNPQGLPISTEREVPVLSNQATIKIQRLGVTAPIVFDVGSDLKDVYNNLENGTVHYSSSPKPGAKGASVILGHSSAYPWYKGAYGSVFALLGKLNPGDVISIEYSNGQKFTFLVKQSILFSPFTDDSRLTEIEKSSSSSIVLVSCWPIGTDYKRIAIHAELI